MAQCIVGIDNLACTLIYSRQTPEIGNLGCKVPLKTASAAVEYEVHLSSPQIT